MKTLTATPRFHLSAILGDLTIGHVWKAVQVSRERRRLAELDPRMLADIGLTEAQAAHEANRSFWDLPAKR